jgi:Tfp pilus assembly protein PilF
LAIPAAVLRWLSYLESHFPSASSAFGHTGWFTFVCWVMGCLCLATFWGQGQQRRWIRWTGLAVSLFNLAIFPPLGLTGLACMRRFNRFHHPEDTDAGTVGEESRSIRIARTVLVFFVIAAGYTWLDTFADRLGIASHAFGWQTVLVILMGQVVIAVIHDLAHTVAAALLGFRFPDLRIGPFTWTAGGGLLSGAGQWNRLFAHDSYLNGIPKNPDSARVNLILASAAGPVVTLLAALSLLLAMLQSSGTPLAHEGRLIGVLAFLFALDFTLNMLPFGFSDARVLVDLLRNNSRGQKIVRQMEAALSGRGFTGINKDSTANVLPVPDPVAQRRDLLNRLIGRGVSGGLQLAQAHQDLGIVECLTGNLVSARELLDRSIELFAAFPEPEHKGRTWLWIEKIHRCNQLAVESHYAYGRGVQAWEAKKSSAKNMEVLAEARISLAFLHLGQSELGTCMEELEKVEANPPRDPMLMARFHHAVAVSAFRLRWQQRATRHVNLALKILRGEKLLPEQRGLGLLLLGDLAKDLWHAGQGILAAEILAEVSDKFCKGGVAPLSTYFRLLRAEILAKTGNSDAATAELDAVVDPDSDQERWMIEIAGWAALTHGDVDKAAHHFDLAANTLDERERARVQVAEARALFSDGKRAEAGSRARAACDVLMREEHGEAGIALLLLCAKLYAEHPDTTAHPFFEEGRRIVRSARFQPAPDKLLALRDLVHLYASIDRQNESAELQEEMLWVLNQISWQTEAPVDEPIDELAK